MLEKGRQMSAKETISISHFKATCLAVLERVRRTGMPIIVTKRGEPIARIDPPPLPEKEASWLGSFRTQGTIHGDVVSPAAPEDDWAALRG